MKKKKVTVVLSLGAAAFLLIGGISVYAHQTSDSGESETVYKETTAESFPLAKFASAVFNAFSASPMASS